jgi:hypothetical protein
MKPFYWERRRPAKCRIVFNRALKARNRIAQGFGRFAAFALGCVASRFQRLTKNYVALVLPAGIILTSRRDGGAPGATKSNWGWKPCDGLRYRKANPLSP